MNDKIKGLKLGANDYLTVKEFDLLVELIRNKNVALDSNEDGSIFGTLADIQFTAVDYTGREAIIDISMWLDAINVRSVFAMQYAEGNDEALRSDGFVRMDYSSYLSWMNQRHAALIASGNYSDDVIAMFSEEHRQNLTDIRNGHYVYLFEDADGSGLIRVLHNLADGEFVYTFRISDEGVIYIEFGIEGNGVGFAAPIVAE